MYVAGRTLGDLMLARSWGVVWVLMFKVDGWWKEGAEGKRGSLVALELLKEFFFFTLTGRPSPGDPR